MLDNCKEWIPCLYRWRCQHFVSEAHAGPPEAAAVCWQQGFCCTCSDCSPCSLPGECSPPEKWEVKRPESVMPPFAAMTETLSSHSFKPPRTTYFIPLNRSLEVACSRLIELFLFFPSLCFAIFSVLILFLGNLPALRGGCCRSRSRACTYTLFLAPTMMWILKPCATDTLQAEAVCRCFLVNGQLRFQPTTSTKSQSLSEDTSRWFQFPKPLSFPSWCPRHNGRDKPSPWCPVLVTDPQNPRVQIVLCR